NTRRTSRVSEVRRTNGLVAETASWVGFAARTKAWKAAGLVRGSTVTIPDRPRDRTRIGHDLQIRRSGTPSIAVCGLGRYFTIVHAWQCAPVLTRSSA